MLKNTTQPKGGKYGLISKTFHWVTALIIFALLLVGYYFDEISYGATQFQLLSLHKSFGLLVLWFAALRIIWNSYSSRPKHVQSHKKWETILAKCTHITLYTALLGMPLSGYIMSLSGGYPVLFFGIPMPSFLEKNAQINDLAWLAHQWLSYFLIGGIFLHVMGALKHHFIDKDVTLKRMMPTQHKAVLAIIIIIFSLFIGGLIRLLLF